MAPDPVDGNTNPFKYRRASRMREKPASPSIPAAIKKDTTTTHAPTHQATMHLLPVAPLLLVLTALPTLPAMPTTPSSALDMLQKRAPKCHDTPRHLSPPLNLVDCISALNQLPATDIGGTGTHTTDVNGRFSSTAPPGSHFKLPRHFAHGGCMIGVAMAPVADAEMSNWNSVARGALGVIRSCVQEPQPADKVGGSDSVGPRGGVQVDVFTYQRYLAFLVDLNKPPAIIGGALGVA